MSITSRRPATSTVSPSEVVTVTDPEATSEAIDRELRQRRALEEARDEFSSEDRREKRLINRRRELRDEGRQFRHQLLRFSTGGNAGGVIACLGLIGAMIGSDSESTFPRTVFWVLLVFVLGLFGSWLSLLGERRLAHLRERNTAHEMSVGGMINPIHPDYGARHVPLRKIRMTDWLCDAGLWVSGALLFGGVLAALIVLFTLSSPG